MFSPLFDLLSTNDPQRYYASHLGACDTDFQQIGIVFCDFGVDASNVISEDERDVTRVDSFQHELEGQLTCIFANMHSP